MRENFQEKSLQVVNKKNIFSIIGDFLRKLWIRKENTEPIEKIERLENKKDTSKKTFMDSLKLDVYFLELQRKLKLGEITLKDLNEEEKDHMIELYQKQIKEKKSKLYHISQRILFYKNQLKQS